MKAKRIFAGLSALTLATAMLTVSAFASEAPERTEIKPNDSGNPDPNPASTTVTYSVDPGYTVTIPTAVKLSDKKNVYDAVSASEVCLAKGSKIVVSLADTNDFKLYNGDASIDYQVSNTAGKLAAGDKVKEFTADGSETLTFAQIDKETVQYAGDYTGSLTFDIAVEGAAATGYVPKLCDKNSDGNYLVSSFYDGTNVLFESLSKEEAQALAAELSEDPAGRPVRLVFEIHPDNNLYVNTVGPDGTTNGFLLSTTNYTSFYTLYYVPKQS